MGGQGERSAGWGGGELVSARATASELRAQPAQLRQAGSGWLARGAAAAGGGWRASARQRKERKERAGARAAATTTHRPRQRATLTVCSFIPSVASYQVVNAAFCSRSAALAIMPPALVSALRTRRRSATRCAHASHAPDSCRFMMRAAQRFSSTLCALPCAAESAQVPKAAASARLANLPAARFSSARCVRRVATHSRQAS